MSTPGTRRRTKHDLTVFVIDDEYLHGEHAKETLSDAGWVVVGFECDADTGIPRIAETKPDIVLLDIRFGAQPRGFEIAKRVRAEARENDRKPPFVFFLTGHGDSETRQRAIDFGGSAYFEKPFAPDALVAEFAKLPQIVHNWRVEEQASELNSLRTELLQKQRSGVLSASEKKTLSEIQEQHAALLESISTLDTDRAGRILKELRNLPDE